MSISRGRRISTQLPLFACPHSKPETRLSQMALSTDAQQRLVQLLAQLLRQHRAALRATAATAEVRDE